MTGQYRPTRNDLLLLLLLLLLAQNLLTPLRSVERDTRGPREIQPSERPAYYKLFQVDSIRILRQPRGVCQARVIALIHSKNSHNSRRDLIRQLLSRDNDVIRPIFVLGSSTNSSLQRYVLNESRVHHDILLVDTLEDYYNISYKAAAAYRYLARCQSPVLEHLVKLDDDTVVNVMAIRQRLAQMPPSELHIHCSHQDTYTPFRDPSMKWSVSVTEYPRLTYPRYCHGAGVVLTSAVVKYISILLPSTPYFKIDDVFIFGLVVEYLDITWTRSTLISTKNEALKVSNPEELIEFIFQQKDDNDFVFLWKRLQPEDNRITLKMPVT